jgi:putative transport protein
MERLEIFLITYPELALFLTIGLGYWIGRWRVGSFRVGPVTGSLFAGIAVGQFAHIDVPGMTKSFLFLLFLFGIGYSVGPQFMQALKRDGFKPIVLAVVVCVTGLAAAVFVAKFLGLDPGFAAGLLSGALTESPAMGTATEAINALPISLEERARLVAHIGVADAVCYIFGAAGIIWFLSSLAPRLIGADLVAEAQKLERELGISRQSQGVISGWRPFELRAYRVSSGGMVVGRSISEIERSFVEQRLFVQRVRRGNQLLIRSPDQLLHEGDVVAVSGKREALVNIIGPASQEVEDRELLDIPIAAYDLLLTNKEVIGRTLKEVASCSWAQGVHLRGINRGGMEIPVTALMELLRGDLLRVVGPEAIVENIAQHIGPTVRPTEATDFVTLGLAIFMGGVAGILIAVPLGSIRISLGTSVGTLLAGLVVGHLRTRHPLFGQIPDGAVSLMTALGLAAFVAITGLHAGPVFFSAIGEVGIGLFFGGMFVTLLPQIVGLYFGRYVLKMDPVTLLGALAGAQTMTAGMAAVQERSRSAVAVLGYTPAVPVGHILLTIWGTVIVSIMAG